MKNENENNQPEGLPGNFGLPEGYFQKSAHSIMNKIEWQEELKEFRVLSELQKSSGFNVPDTYFEKNEQKLELLDYPRLSEIGKSNHFRVPVAYFSDREILEMAKVQNEEADVVSPFLESLKISEVFNVPESYFEITEKRITEKLMPREAKVISLFSRRLAFAAAAAFIVVMGLWMYNFYFIPVAVEDCGTIACVDRQDLVKSKSLERLDDDELYELVDPKLLEKQLEKKTEIKNQTNKTDSSFDNLSEEDLLENI